MLRKTRNPNRNPRFEWSAIPSLPECCFIIYQIKWIKKCCFINVHNFFFWNVRETTRHFSLRSQNSEHPRIFQVTGANQNARTLLSTDLVNTKILYCHYLHLFVLQIAIKILSTFFFKHMSRIASIKMNMIFFKVSRNGPLGTNHYLSRREGVVLEKICLNNQHQTL